MKKIILFLTTLTILSFTSCNFFDITNETKDATITSPSVSNISNGLLISPTTVTGTEYINIFRYSVTSDTDSTRTNDPIVIIGQITPSETYTGTVMFTDLYAAEGVCYQYYVRYKTANSYRYSKSTGTYKASGTAGIKEIKSTTDGVEQISLSLDEGQYLLSFASSLATIPTPANSNKTFNIMVALSNGTSTLLFPMSYDDGNKKYTISLRNALPDLYLNKDLSMKYIVGQTTEEITDGLNSKTVNYTTYHWTLPCNAIAVNSKNETLTSFTVPTDLADNGTTDFTPSANKLNFTLK